MAAELVEALAPHLPHHLLLPPREGAASAVEEVRHGLGPGGVRGPVVLEAGAWRLRLPEMRELQELLEATGLHLLEVHASDRQTLVAAADLGLPTRWPLDGENRDAAARAREEALTIHRGTLRSGDHLQAEGSVLLLGDVNPGARISAGGNVLIWGRLRGVAHAGMHGDRTVRIVALHLRPLQLRIADAVARGPEDSPPEGLVEEARLVDGAIRIDPASPSWPLVE